MVQGARREGLLRAGVLLRAYLTGLLVSNPDSTPDGNAMAESRAKKGVALAIRRTR